MTFTCWVKRNMAGSTLNKGVSGHLSVYMNYSGYNEQSVTIPETYPDEKEKPFLLQKLSERGYRTVGSAGCEKMYRISGFFQLCGLFMMPKTDKISTKTQREPAQG